MWLLGRFLGFFTRFFYLLLDRLCCILDFLFGLLDHLTGLSHGLIDLLSGLFGWSFLFAAHSSTQPDGDHDHREISAHK